MLAFSVASCVRPTCTEKLKKIRGECPELFIPDTIVFHDTIKVQEARIDTFFSAKTDTLFIDKKRIMVKYKRVRDTVYLSAECKQDTLVLVRKIFNPIKINVKAYILGELKDFLRRNSLWLLLFLVVLLTIFASKAFKHRV